MVTKLFSFSVVYIPPDSITYKEVHTYHVVPDFEFGRKKLSPQVTTDSDTVFREESIGEGFKIVIIHLTSKRSDAKNRDMYMILLKKDVFEVFLQITSFKSNFEAKDGI